MSGLVFVRDAQGTPLMPMAAAYARRLLDDGKATICPHHAFTIIQLTNTIPDPTLQQVVLTVVVHLHTAELLLVADGRRTSLPLFRLIVDLQTDLGWRMRRRAGHRRRRRQRGRYRAPNLYGGPVTLQRPSLARSRWRKLLKRPQGRRRPAGPAHVPATIRWRAQAIERVIDVLRSLLPISRISISVPYIIPPPRTATEPASDIRDRLVEAYGEIEPNGQRRAMCAYCGTTERTIVVDHIVPKSRGGTDSWYNLVLACQPCNDKKSDRLPEEAGMKLRVTLIGDPRKAQRDQPHIEQTARQLKTSLGHSNIQVILLRSATNTADDQDLGAEHSQQGISGAVQIPLFVAKPTPRPRKQRFTGRNYKLSTPTQVPYIRLRETVKRRVQVNAGLAVWHRDAKIQTQVIPYGEDFPEDTLQVKIGMLCEGQRSDKLIVGIVAAIHSTGRLTLLVPDSAGSKRVFWQRVIISPRKHLRVLSSDRMLFFRMKE